MALGTSGEAFVPRAAAFALALLLAACGGGGSPTSPTLAPPSPPPPAPPRVVIISIDGLRPEGIIQSDSPVLLALAARGAYTWQAQTVLPSNTLPAHTSMLTGFPPSGHGITWDDYLPQRGTVKVPTLFATARAAGLRTVMVVGKAKFEHLNLPGTVDTYVMTSRGDVDVANEAVVQAGTRFDLMFVHFPQTDLAGHSLGWMSPAYLAQVSQTDDAVGRILESLPPNTTVILSSDHGGEGRNHGTSTTKDMTIPWIIAGPRIPPNHRLTQRVNTTDTAATAAFLLGLTLPPTAQGRLVSEAFNAPAPPATP